MKKQLQVFGTVSLNRSEVTKILETHLKEKEELVVMKVEYPFDFEELAISVKGIDSTTVPEEFKAPSKRKVTEIVKTHKKKFTRPNFGIGKFLREEIFKNVDCSYTLHEILDLARKNGFPNLNRKSLKSYLTRSDMVGKVTHIGNRYRLLEAVDILD